MMFHSQILLQIFCIQLTKSGHPQKHFYHLTVLRVIMRSRGLFHQMHSSNYSWLPFYLLSCLRFVSLIWVCLRLVSQRIVKSLERNIVISFISIMFLLHPKLTENALSIFRCIDIDDGESRVRLDTSMECYSYEHLKW